MVSYPNFFGGFLAFLSAFLWAAASLIWNKLNKQNIAPISISLGKAVTACCCFILAALFIGYDLPDKRNCLVLLVSGFLGISIGDTAFFYSLKYLGLRNSALLTVFIPIVVVLLAFLFLGEQLSFVKFFGIAACIYGTVAVVREHIPAGAPGNRRAGIAWACVSIVSCALSILISKTALSSVGAFEASLLRLGSGTVGLLLLCAVKKNSFKEALCVLKPSFLKTLFLGSFFGTFLGIWCFIMALKYTLTSIATAVSGTSPIFVLLLSYWLLRERISKNAAWGTVIAVSGGVLVLVF